MNEYFYIDENNVQQGPVSVQNLLAAGVKRDTMVWRQGMADWMRACTVPELEDLFRATPPPPYGQETPGQANQSCGNAYGNHPYPCPPTHLVKAILVTLCCCLPLGIVAIVKASEVNSFYAAGRYEQALLSSADADKWGNISLILGILSFALFGGIGMLS